MQTDAKSTKQPKRKPAGKGKLKQLTTTRKTRNTPQPESGKKSTSPNARARGPRRLTVRQERFCEFIAAGESGVNAWVKAGYGCSREVARRNAAESLTKPDIAARIAQLRAPQTKKCLATKERKRELCAQFMESENASMMARIRAMEVDAKLAGHYEPDRVEVETGPVTLAAIRERALAVATALAR